MTLNDWWKQTEGMSIPHPPFIYILLFKTKASEKSTWEISPNKRILPLFLCLHIPSHIHTLFKAVIIENKVVTTFCILIKQSYNWCGHQKIIFKVSFLEVKHYMLVRAWNLHSWGSVFYCGKILCSQFLWEGEGRGHARKPQQVAFLEEGTSWP